MKMGGDCCSQTHLVPPTSKPLLTDVVLYGDYFDRDTRSLQAMCKLAEVQVKFKFVDTFNGSNTDISYKQNFKTTMIPSIQIGKRTQVKRDDGDRELF